jgi:DNA modification methylase
MLFKKQAHGKTLYASKSLLVSPQQAYIRPPDNGNDWFQTSTTIWRVDELIKRRVRDWKRLLGEDGHTGSRSETMRADHDSAYTATHSVFPAPLVEWILLRYGGPPGSSILDAFAGGPVRAVVSTIMGFKYLGFDIRQEQIDENNRTLEKLALGNEGVGAEFILGDGRFLNDGNRDFGPFDVALTCPPYWNLEVYSDRDDDLSNFQTYEQFRAGIAMCAMSHYPLMKPGAFVCTVVGPFRNKKTGELIDFPGHTIEDFREAGFTFWQNVILTKNFGSACIRSTNAWLGQKLIPLHEHLLVFRKPG